MQTKPFSLIEILAERVAAGWTIEQASREMGVTPTKDGRKRIEARVAELRKQRAAA